MSNTEGKQERANCISICKTGRLCGNGDVKAHEESVGARSAGFICKCLNGGQACTARRETSFDIRGLVRLGHSLLWQIFAIAILAGYMCQCLPFPDRGIRFRQWTDGTNRFFHSNTPLSVKFQLQGTCRYALAAPAAVYRLCPGNL